jgi:DMSO/TMAO reductase YedYZ molybdopterin-dependent catalytic subunit
MRETNVERAERYAAEEAELKTIPLEEFRRVGRRRFLTGAGAAALGVFGWRWVQTQPSENNIPGVLRTGLERNERIWSGLFRDGHSAPTFARSKSSVLRVNGRHGVREEVDLDTWELNVVGPDGTALGTHLMDEIRALPKYEMTIEHKCIEGWSHIVTWGGARFSDFAELYADEVSDNKFVSLETPDGDYYVGMDRDSMMHHQTLLAYELQGEPLSSLHGAPLRLATPLKYGIKQLKRIGKIQFTDVQPRDYWGDRGYDWYAGL